jgi:molybdenum-dependent DNA-binding transcriptional regulator ModE
VAEQGVLGVSARSPQDQVLAEAIAAGMTIKAAAEKAGMNYRTARRHLAKGLRAELDAWRRQVAAGLAAGLAELADAALETAEELLTDPETPAQVRRAVMRDVFEAFRAIGVEQDNAARLAAIEERLGIDPRTGWKARVA